MAVRLVWPQAGKCNFQSRSVDIINRHEKGGAEAVKKQIQLSLKTLQPHRRGEFCFYFALPQTVSMAAATKRLGNGRRDQCWRTTQQRWRKP
jgi:hypothetical protein